MSIVKQITIRCDSCNEEHDDADWRAAIVREEARRDGWRINLPGGRDLCPDCKEQK